MRNTKLQFTILFSTLILILLFLEFFFRYVIPAAEKPIAYYDEQYNMLRSDEKNRTKGIYTLGKFAQIRAHWSINNYGWNSDYDYYPEKKNKKLICLIGDSYVRALQVDTDKSITWLLNKGLSDNYSVYGFGYDGAPLSQYLHISRFVNQVFDPDVLMFLIIHNDFDQSIRDYTYKPYYLQLAIKDDKVIEIQPEKQNLYQFFTYSSTFRYLYSNLKLASIYFNVSKKLKNFNENVDTDNLYKFKDEMILITDYIIGKIKSENNDKRIIFVMNAPKQDIYENRLENSSLIWVNKMVREISAKHGVEFIDLAQKFNSDYMNNRKKFNFEYDGHWNTYGHYLASKVIINYLNSDTN